MAHSAWSRLTERLLPPWFVIDPPAADDDVLLAEFRGPWSKVFVTKCWVYVSTTMSGWKTPIRVDEIANVSAGVDPSPRDEGPLWGIWMTSRSGYELEAFILRPHAARDLIQELAGGS
jgi:hypothetical protein